MARLTDLYGEGGGQSWFSPTYGFAAVRGKGMKKGWQFEMKESMPGTNVLNLHEIFSFAIWISINQIIKSMK